MNLFTQDLVILLEPVHDGKKVEDGGLPAIASSDGAGVRAPKFLRHITDRAIERCSEHRGHC